MFDRIRFVEDCRLIREQSPLVLNITNYVAMTPTANALLAVGASPLMSFCPEEMLDLVHISGAVVINIGCLDRQLVQASRIAAAAAQEAGIPWVFDPVGAGASKLRSSIASDLAAHYRPSVIRGNASEIIALAKELGAGDAPRTGCGPRGVDSSSTSADALGSGRKLALVTEAAVSISGETDYIMDRERTESIINGSVLMTRVTAMGCTASALTAAFAAVDSSPCRAALNAMALMGVCGGMASESCHGTGSFMTKFLDTLSTLDPEEAAERVREQA